MACAACKDYNTHCYHCECCDESDIPTRPLKKVADPSPEEPQNE